MGVLQLQKPAAPEVDVITLSDSTIQKSQTEGAPTLIPAGVETPTPLPDPTWITPNYHPTFKLVAQSKEEMQ